MNYWCFEEDISTWNPVFQWLMKTSCRIFILFYVLGYIQGPSDSICLQWIENFQVTCACLSHRYLTLRYFKILLLQVLLRLKIVYHEFCLNLQNLVLKVNKSAFWITSAQRLCFSWAASACKRQKQHFFGQVPLAAPHVDSGLSLFVAMFQANAPRPFSELGRKLRRWPWDVVMSLLDAWRMAGTGSGILRLHIIGALTLACHRANGERTLPSLLVSLVRTQKIPFA